MSLGETTYKILSRISGGKALNGILKCIDWKPDRTPDRTQGELPLASGR